MLTSCQHNHLSAHFMGMQKCACHQLHLAHWLKSACSPNLQRTKQKTMSQTLNIHKGQNPLQGVIKESLSLSTQTPQQQAYRSRYQDLAYIVTHSHTCIYWLHVSRLHISRRQVLLTESAVRTDPERSLGQCKTRRCDPGTAYAGNSGSGSLSPTGDWSGWRKGSWKRTK